MPVNVPKKLVAVTAVPVRYWINPFLQPKLFKPKSYVISALGTKLEINLAVKFTVSDVAFPKTPTPLNVKFPLIVAFPDVTKDAELICPPTPSPPVTTNAPFAVVVEAVEFVIVTVPPMKAFPPNPRPPVTTKAPMLVAVELVACDIVTVLVLVLLVNVVDPSTLDPVAE